MRQGRRVGVVYRRVLDEKENEIECTIILRGYRWRSRCAEECAKRIPTALTLQSEALVFDRVHDQVFWARPGAEGEGKSCRPLLSTSHVPALFT